jgi:hypothetical protein
MICACGSHRLQEVAGPFGSVHRLYVRSPRSGSAARPQAVPSVWLTTDGIVVLGQISDTQARHCGNDFRPLRVLIYINARRAPFFMVFGLLIVFSGCDGYLKSATKDYA